MIKIFGRLNVRKQFLTVLTNQRLQVDADPTGQLLIGVSTDEAAPIDDENVPSMGHLKVLLARFAKVWQLKKRFPGFAIFASHDLAATKAASGATRAVWRQIIDRRNVVKLGCSWASAIEALFSVGHFHSPDAIAPQFAAWAVHNLDLNLGKRLIA